jgi:1-acyl-sn-glycerol-3-phosphate acyltransferase
MIQAAKNPLGERLVWRLVRSSLRSHFHAVHVRRNGDEQIAHLPTIYYVNHSNWWDGYLCMALNQLALRQDCYLAMEQKNLRRYRFFAWAGVFGLDRDDGRDALAALDYAAALLKDHPERAAFMFPEGTMAPNDHRPLRFYSGVAHLARRVGDVRIIPIVLRYEFLQEQRPEAFISVGPPQIVSAASLHPRALTASLATTLTTELDALRDDVVAERLADFQPILQGKGGVDRIFDRAMSRGRRESRRLSRVAGG